MSSSYMGSAQPFYSKNVQPFYSENVQRFYSENVQPFFSDCRGICRGIYYGGRPVKGLVVSVALRTIGFAGGAYGLSLLVVRTVVVLVSGHPLAALIPLLFGIFFVALGYDVNRIGNKIRNLGYPEGGWTKLFSLNSLSLYGDDDSDDSGDLIRVNSTHSSLYSSLSSSSSSASSSPLKVPPSSADSFIDISGPGFGSYHGEYRYVEGTYIIGRIARVIGQ